jgi:hypothetical protein
MAYLLTLPEKEMTLRSCYSPFEGVAEIDMAKNSFRASPLCLVQLDMPVLRIPAQHKGMLPLLRNA